MRMEMEELCSRIESMAAEKAKGKQVAEDPGSNNLESTPENGNSGSQLPNPEQQAPPNLKPTSHVATTSQPTQQQVWPGAYAYPPQGYYYPRGIIHNTTQGMAPMPKQHQAGYISQRASMTL